MLIRQYGGTSILSKRHRLYNNLPGHQDFCPLVRRTEKLDAFIQKDLSFLAHQETGAIHPGVLARASAFLLLKDSRASFSIEGKTPAKTRTERWGRAIAQAGSLPLTCDELLRLQSIVIEDHRFVPLGFRQEGGFIGVHENSTQLPLPDHILARWQNIPRLMDGWFNTYHRLCQEKQLLDAVLAATVLAFGFVFIHPFVDGNGRLHRYLIHHILADLHFTPKGIIFPISSVILKRIHDYKVVLETYSRPRLRFIKWIPTLEGNVNVLNETLDLYRYFDATPMAEFLYECIEETIEDVLPDEVRYLECYDRLKHAISQFVDMPTHLIDLLIRFLEQNEGKLSKRAKDKEFSKLTQEECLHLEYLYHIIFHTDENVPNLILSLNND